MSRFGCLAAVLLNVALWCAAQSSGPQEQINTLFQSSFERIGEGEWERAESDTREILGLALDQLGVLQAALERFELAERAHREAMRASVRGGSSSLLGLTILYLRTGQFQKGIETANRILEFNPLHPEARHALGKIYFLQGRFSEAVSELSDSYRSRRDDLSVAYTLALAYLEQKRFEPAAQVFEELKESLGDSARLRVLIGRAYRETGFYEAAVRQFEEAAALDPMVPRAHHYLGLTYLLWKGSTAFPEAEAAFRKELEIVPDSYFPNFFLGVILTQTRRNAEAVEHLRRAAEVAPDSPDPYVHLGQALYQQKEYEQTVEALSRAIELTTDPSRNNYQIAKSHYVLGRALLALGRHEEGQRQLRLSQKFKRSQSQAEGAEILAYMSGSEADLRELAAGSEPGESRNATILDFPAPDPATAAVFERTAQFYRSAAGNAYQQMARIMTARARLARAVDYLEKAVFWEPDTPGAFLNLGIARLKAGDAPGAVGPLIEAARRGQSPDEARRLIANLALSLVEQREREPAARAVGFLLESNPEVPELHLLRGHLEARQGRFAEALEAYRHALTLAPGLPEGHYWAGTVLIRLGRLDEALAEFEEELERDADHPKALYHKAFVLVSNQRFEEALPLLERVIRLDPAYADAYYQLGKIQLAQDQLLLATANLETAAYHAPAAAHVHYQLSRVYAKAGREEDSRRALERYRKLKRAAEEAQLARQP